MNTIVSMNEITKVFGGVPAVRNVSFDIRRGEVHALLGENGAGKSTLMKILSGAYEPTSGTMTIDGSEHERLTPRQSADVGISIIYQELSVIDQLTIAENLFVGRQPSRRLLGIPVVDAKSMNARTVELLESVGLGHQPSTVLGSLSISEKQMVEILKAIAFGARVIVMDEPTSSLTEEEVGRLFGIIRRLREAGTSIVYITHKLKEVIEIADRVTVLKDGAAVSTLDVDHVTIDSLVTAMVGRELKAKYLAPHGSTHGTNEVVLEVNGLTRKDNKVKDVSFVLRRGEILGFSGLVGAGRSELMSAIYGAEPLRAGTVSLHGRELRIRNPFDAMRAGIALVTEDRRQTGFFRNFSIKRNIAIGTQVKTAKFGGLWGLTDGRAENRIAAEQCAAMNVKCRDVEQNIVELSGGNQQKVLLGRWMAAGAEVFIFDEPTKGIDVGTKAEIYGIMRRLADEGVGVIVVSSELPEVLAVCDRILVFADGQIQAEYSAEEATEEELVRSATVTTELERG